MIGPEGDRRPIGGLWWSAMNASVYAVGSESAAAAQGDAEEKQQLCKFWPEGKCWHGAKCRFKHDGKPGGEIRGESRSGAFGSLGSSEGPRWFKGAWRADRDSLGHFNDRSRPYRSESRIGVSRAECEAAGLNRRSAKALRAEREAELDSWWEKKVAGVCKALGVEAAVAEKMLLGAQGQDLLVRNSKDLARSRGGAAAVAVVKAAAKTVAVAGEAASSEASADPIPISAPNQSELVQTGAVFVVIADTGATVRVIGQSDVSRAVNVRKLSVPVTVHGAGGASVVTYEGDLPGYAGLMEGCLIMPDCLASLLPVVSVCEELGYSYEIAQGGQSASFSIASAKMVRGS